MGMLSPSPVCHSVAEAGPKSRGGTCVVVSPVLCEIPDTPRHPPGCPGPAQDVHKSPAFTHKVFKRPPCRVGGGIRMLCGWKAGGGEPRRRGREEEEGRAGAGAWRIGCPSARSEGGREEDAPAPGLRAGQGPRLRPGGAWRVRFQPGLRIPGGRQKGRRRPFLFRERSRVGWARRSPRSFLFAHFFVGIQSPLSPHRLWGHFPRAFSGSARSLFPFPFLRLLVTV